MTGSDQVWCPIAAEKYDEAFFLSFVKNNKKKIAYAASFGVASIPYSQINKTRHYLNRIQSISTREVSGQKIIKDLTGRNIPVVCDPTILIDKDYWDKLSGTKRFIEQKYIFCYFLGNNPTHRTFAEKIKEKTGYQLVALQHLDELVLSDIEFADIKPFNIGPAEFVNLVRNAEYVLTDSFHGTIFSLLYKKHFFTFSRFESKTKASTNSRIDSLLNYVGASDRHITAAENIDGCLQLKIDYENVHKYLDNFKQESREYLFNALKTTL
jgi:hypothetical protein